MPVHVVSTHVRVRASKPKVRSGCKICKKRRVKCDENKPDCNRCRRLGLECEYQSDLRTVFRKEPLPTTISYRPLRPRGESSANHRSITSINLLRVPSRTALFTDDNEYRYFSVFRDKTASTLSGYFKTSLWHRMVLQACESHAAVRHAVIAIGALDQTLNTTQQRGVKEPWTSSRNSATDVFSRGMAHHQFALRQYGRAISQMRDSLTRHQPDYRTAMMVCMLTVCFEALNGDMQSAMTQLRNGLKLIKEYLPPGEIGISARLSSAGEIHEIIRAFDRLDNDSVVTQDVEPIDLSSDAGARTPDDAMERMPDIFPTIEEAKAYYEYIVHEFLHWIAYQYAWGSRARDEPKQRQRVQERQITVVSERQKYLEAFSQWYRAFQPVLVASSSESHEDFAGAIALDCRFKALDAANNVNHFLGEMGYDEVTPKFQEVVHLAQRLVRLEMKQDNTRAAKYTFEGTIVSSCYAVALKCRDTSVRGQAMAILESRPRREGIFDSALQAKIARLQIQIEEAGKVGDFIPEHARIRGIKTSSDMMKRKGHMKYLKMVPGTRNFEYHHLDFTW